MKLMVSQQSEAQAKATTKSSGLSQETGSKLGQAPLEWVDCYNKALHVHERVIQWAEKDWAVNGRSRPEAAYVV